MSFKRIKDLTQDRQVFTDALGNANLLEFNDDKSAIRRVTAFDEKAVADENTAAIVCASGFPKDSTLDEIIALFGKYGKVALVRCRRAADVFSGVAWVEFENADSADAAAQDKDLVFAEKPIKVVLKSAYLDNKTTKPDKRAEKTPAPEPVKVEINEAYVPTWESGTLLIFTVTGSIDNVKQTVIDLVKDVAIKVNVGMTSATAGYLRFDEPKAAEALEKVGAEQTIDENKSISFKVASDEEMTVIKHEIARERTRFDYESGRIVRFTFAVVPTVELESKALRKEFSVLGDVKFVDYNAGSIFGYARFAAPVSAETLTASAPKTLAKDLNITVEIVKDEEEWSYWQKIGQASAASSSRDSGRGGRGGRGGKRQGGRGGRGGRDNKRQRN